MKKHIQVYHNARIKFDESKPKDIELVAHRYSLYSTWMIIIVIVIVNKWCCHCCLCIALLLFFVFKQHFILLTTIKKYLKKGYFYVNKKRGRKKNSSLSIHSNEIVGVHVWEHLFTCRCIYGHLTRAYVCIGVSVKSTCHKMLNELTLHAKGPLPTLASSEANCVLGRYHTGEIVG